MDFKLVPQKDKIFPRKSFSNRTSIQKSQQRGKVIETVPLKETKTEDLDIKSPIVILSTDFDTTVEGMQRRVYEVRKKFGGTNQNLPATDKNIQQTPILEEIDLSAMIQNEPEGCTQIADKGDVNGNCTDVDNGTNSSINEISKTLSENNNESIQRSKEPIIISELSHVEPSKPPKIQLQDHEGIVQEIHEVQSKTGDSADSELLSTDKIIPNGNGIFKPEICDEKRNEKENNTTFHSSNDKSNDYSQTILPENKRVDNQTFSLPSISQIATETLHITPVVDESVKQKRNSRDGSEIKLPKTISAQKSNNTKLKGKRFYSLESYYYRKEVIE